MPKTEVILTHNIVGLGGESDQVKVAAGYARNYLYPQGLAIPVTAGNRRRLEALKQRRAEREAHELNSMTELAKSLAKMTLTMLVKTGDDGKMFGSVTNGAIADELKNQFEIELDKKKIHIEKPIKSLGDYEVEMRLHHDVKTNLKVVVKSSTPIAAPVEPVPAPDAGRGDREGRRGERDYRGRGDAKARAEVKAEAKPEAKSEGKPEGKGRPARAAKAE
jgi:large subunit ribosomal protein L9